MESQDRRKETPGENDKADAGQVITDPKDHHVQAVSFNYERQQWKLIDPAIQPDLDYLKTVSDGDIQIGSRSLDDRFWTVAYTRMPARPSRISDDRANKESDIHLHQQEEPGRPAAGQDASGRHSIARWAGHGLLLHHPAGGDADQDASPIIRCPLVLDVHGGPWARDAFGFNPEHQWLANRGYAVISVNYRGSTGFGKKFVNAGNKEWAGKMHDDLIDASTGP
jgi:dipeptidyl aminopeptidase/acylaminoacyl peptidase